MQRKTVAKRRFMTAEEFLLMPETDGKRYELIHGVLSEKVGPGEGMAPGDLHAIAVGRFATAISVYSDENDYGQTRTGEPGYRLANGPDIVRAPDVAWIAPGRVPEGTRGYPQLAPDLVVEVKSPSNSYAALADKAAMWLSHGSRAVWVGDPDHTDVTVYRPGVSPILLGEDDVLDGGDVLPGFSIPVWRLFRRQH